MDLLLVLLCATALTALGLVADRVDRDLRGGNRGDRRADPAGGGAPPLRLDLLAISPAEFASVGPARAGAPEGGPIPDGANRPAPAESSAFAG